MSFQSLADVFTYVQSCDDIPTSEVVTLLALAHHKNSKTGACFPSIATLRKTTKLSRRGQQRALRRLEQRGVLATEFHPDHRSSSYTLCLPDLAPLPKQTSGIRTPQCAPPAPPEHGRNQEANKDPAAPPPDDTPSLGQTLMDIAARIQTAWRLGITPDSAIWRAMVGLGEGEEAPRWAT